MSSSSDSAPARQVALVLSGWPRVSEVFALNEVLALQRAGMLAALFATKGQEDALRQPGTSELDTMVRILPEGDAATQAAEVAQLLQDVPVSGLHGYFAHQPAAVAAGAAALLGLPYSFSVHALDVRKVVPAELARRAHAAAAVICCNSDVAATVVATGRQPTLVPHGVDLTRFPAVSPPSGEQVTLLSVGRLVEKKGFCTLLDALGLLEGTAEIQRPYRLRVVGEGPWRGRLERIIHERRLTHRVELMGRYTHERLPALYADSHVVVVPSVVDRSGDRDGLPNVVLEAMSSARPVVASDAAAISTAVRDGQTGVLVPPGDPRALATALAEMIEDEPRRVALGRNGRLAVESRFELGARTNDFCHTLAAAYA